MPCAPRPVSNGLSPKRFGDMLRQQLRRAGAGSQIIVGGIDGDYDELHQLWQAHFHLIAPAALKPTLDELRDRFSPSSGRVHRPVLTQPVNDPTRQVSYCVKSYWPHKVRYFDDAGEERTTRRRLDNALHADWLVWRDQFPLADFLFLHGVRRYGGELRNARPPGP